MKFAALTSFVLAAVGVSASPVKRTYNDDTVILNYALTLEHIENSFYSGALAQFDEQAFTDAGLPPWARGRFSEIADHEAAHVAFLSKALADKAVQPCQYTFPYTDPASFAALSQVLEGVGVSAYAGAAQYIQDADYLTVAAVVLSTEARHASWVAGAVNKVNPWSGALDIPLSLDEVYTLAASFIVPGSCPTTNVALPVKAFPGFTVGDGAPGATVSVTFDDASTTAGYVAFYTGLSQEVVPIVNGQVTIPADLIGTVYAVATSDSSKATDDNIVAGPAIIVYSYNSQGEIYSN